MDNIEIVIQVSNMARKVSLTESEILSRRYELALLDKEQLNKLSRDRLRELCSGCLDYKSNAKKNELVEKIWVWTEPVRLEKLAAITLIKQELSESNAALSPEEIKSIVKNLSPKEAAKVVRSRLLRELYTQSTITKTYTPRIIKYVNSLEDVPEDYKNIFEISLKRENKEDNKAVNDEYKLSTVPKYSSDRRLVNFSWVIDWANEQLISRRNWKLVTLALTLTSGRRPVEIHCTGSFEVTETPNGRIPDYPIIKGWVKFTGQAKEKENMTTKEAKGTYTIPLLVESGLWIESYNWLVEQGKTGITKDKLNKNYSKEISKTVSQYLAPHNILKWYDCRDFYAGCFRTMHSTLIGQGSKPHLKMGEEVVLSELLGHGAKDISTQHSYGKMAVIYE